MPTYEYKCTACGHTFEKFQSIMAEPIKRCPVCGKAKAKRLISAGAGLIFKGSGFYITDYPKSGSDRASGSKAEAKSGDSKSSDSKSSDSKSSESKSSDSGSTAKTESKTESKSDSKAESKS